MGKKDGIMKRVMKETLSSAIPIPYLNDKIASVAVDGSEGIIKYTIKKTKKK